MTSLWALIIALTLGTAAVLWGAWRLSRLLFAVCLLGLGMLVYVGWIEPRSLGVTHVTIEAPRFQAPLRAVLIADTQSVNYHWPARRLRALVDRANAEQPDIVFLLGDYAGWSHGPSKFIYNDWFHNPPEETIPEFKRLAAPMGVYAVLGNHDWMWNGPLMVDLLRRAGAHVLSNQGVLLDAPQGGQIWLGGVDDYRSPTRSRPQAALDGAPDDVPQILLSHRPDIIAYALHPPDVAFAGHTHGGQICFPVLGCPVRISRRGWNYGLYASRGRPLFVSRGVGTGGLPVRLLAPPEIVVVDIVPASH